MIWIARGLHEAIARLILHLVSLPSPPASPCSSISPSLHPEPQLGVPIAHLPPVPPVQQAIQRIDLLQLPRLVDRRRIHLLPGLGAVAGRRQEGLVHAPQEDVLKLAVGAQAVFGPHGEGALVVLVDDLAMLGN